MTALPTKAYAVLLADCYYLAYADSADEAKGLLLKREPRFWVDAQIHTLRCRRWPEMDGPGSWEPPISKWGTPGECDWDTGVSIEIPEPFANQQIIYTS